MSIPTPFNPLGTLGGGIELLESVHISVPDAGTSENLVQTAFGEAYYLEPFGSGGYFAEVTVDNVSGTNRSAPDAVVAVGNYDHSHLGTLTFYARQRNSKIYDILSVNGKGYTVPLVFQSKINDVFNLHHKVENDVYSGTAAIYSVNENLGSWTAERNARQQITIRKVPGISYDFKKLAAHTEHVKFDALPARKEDKDGIAFFIDGKLTKFIEV